MELTTRLPFCCAERLIGRVTLMTPRVRRRLYQTRPGGFTVVSRPLGAQTGLPDMAGPVFRPGPVRRGWQLLDRSCALADRQCPSPFRRFRVHRTVRMDRTVRRVRDGASLLAVTNTRQRASAPLGLGAHLAVARAPCCLAFVHCRCFDLQRSYPVVLPDVSDASSRYVRLDWAVVMGHRFRASRLQRARGNVAAGLSRPRPGVQEAARQ